MKKKNKWLRVINESNDNASKALAKELGVRGKDIWEESGYEHYEPDYLFGVNLPKGGQAIYLVYDNEESARTAAADDLGERFEEDPANFGAAIDYFGFPRLCEYINGMDDDELDELGELADEMGNEEFASYIQRNVGVDYRGFAEFNIDELGPAWHLADYDGKEIELSNGMYAYRVD